MFWNYLRNKVRDSILAGVNDALTEIDGQGGTDTAEALAGLRVRLLALPAPQPPAATEGESVATEGNGRRRKAV